jgi:antirestriction protein ArdC
MTITDKEQIRKDLEGLAKTLSEDLEFMKAALTKLGATVSTNEDQRAKEYKALEFSASIVKQNLDIVKRLIVHAEYCDWYISENEKCHKNNILDYSSKIKILEDEIKEIKKDIEPLEKIQNGVNGIKYILVMAGSLIALWQGYEKLLSGV